MAQDSQKDKAKRPTKEYLADQEALAVKARKDADTKMEARKKNASASLVYCGPNMAGKITLRQFTVFSGGLPPRLKEVVESDRDMKALFLPVADLAGARLQLNKKGSPLNRAHSETLRKYLASRGAK